MQTMTANEALLANQYIEACHAEIKAGRVWIGGAQVKALTRSNVMQIFPPGVRELVRRVLRGY
jgi:hypothetical protein